MLVTTDLEYVKVHNCTNEVNASLGAAEGPDGRMAIDCSVTVITDFDKDGPAVFLDFGDNDFEDVDQGERALSLQLTIAQAMVLRDMINLALQHRSNGPV